ncbi:hypothetical protein FRC07_005991 [Ceratobasidium sp. 392]|nr:hypothetical protein FRC07_005991 [Ceratobasidium sp. 392]
MSLGPSKPFAQDSPTTIPSPPMAGPQNPKRRRKAPKAAQEKNNNAPACPRLTKEEMDKLGVEQLMCNQFNWKNGARPFQVDATCAQLSGTNVLLHASTGSGKTAVAAGPHAIPAMKGMVTLFVAPLLALHTEMTETFKNKYHLSAIALNSLVETGTKDIFDEIIDGKYQIVTLAPEMLLNQRFVDAVLKSRRFRQRLLSVVIDEAHCISHWGDNFRKLYGAIGLIRAFLLPRTPIVAMSGTLTRRVRRHICKKLGFSLTGGNFLNLNEGNARPNVSIASLPMQHPVESCRDADIVIPPDVRQAEDIEKTFVYCDDKDTIYTMVDHLRSRLPPSINPGVIRPFTASHSAKYRADTMAGFVAGTIRVLVCTEAAGMGCDIPDVALTVQWKTPRTTSNAVQRGGRTARGEGRTGVYIQFNEPASYRVNPTEPAPEPKSRRGKSKGKGKGRANDGTNDPEATQDNATRNRQPDHGFKSSVAAEPELREDSAGEGIYCFVQTTLCRRRIWDKVFGNDPYDVKVPCCDLCNPSFLDKFHFTPRQKATRARRVAKCEVSQPTVRALKQWRDSTFERDYPSATWDSSSFMDDSLINLLSSIDPTATSLDAITGSVQAQWAHWAKYKERIYEVLLSIDETQAQGQPKETDPQSTSAAPNGNNLPEPASNRQSSKRQRLSAPRSSRKPTARKEKLQPDALHRQSEHETRFDDWDIQPMVYDTSGQTEATQSYTQGTFSTSHPTLALVSRSHNEPQRYGHPTVSGFSGYHPTHAPGVQLPQQPMYPPPPNTAYTHLPSPYTQTHAYAPSYTLNDQFTRPSVPYHLAHTSQASSSDQAAYVQPTAPYGQGYPPGSLQVGTQVRKARLHAQ